MIDRHPQAVAVDRLLEGQPVLGDVEELVRRHDVDAVGQDRHAVGRLHHLQRRLALQQFDQVFLREFGMMDQDDGNALPGRHSGENRPERFQGACPGPDTHHDGRETTPGGPVVDGIVTRTFLSFLPYSLHILSPGISWSEVLETGPVMRPPVDVRQEIRSSGSLRGEV